MLIKDVLILAAEHLGRSDLVSAVASAYAAAPAAPTGEVALLLNCYALVENEVALDHLPLRAAETLESGDGTLEFIRFSRPPVDVLSVQDTYGEVAFEVFPARLRLPGSGTYTVVYTYAPAAPQIGGETAFSDKVSARLLSCGVACEFLLAAGRYAEAAVWEEKFRAALRASGISRRKLHVRARRWE